MIRKSGYRFSEKIMLKKKTTMTVSKTAMADRAKARKTAVDGAADGGALEMGELSELLGYSLKRAQLRIFEDFLRCVAPLQLTPAQIGRAHVCTPVT